MMMLRSLAATTAAGAFCLPLLLLLSSSTAAEAANCNIPLQTGSGHECLHDCLGQNAQSSDSFVCDLSAEWMHHVGGSKDWYPATPPKGTGTHEYALFTGASPPCDTNGHCTGCTAPEGTKVCSVFIDPEDCSATCDETEE
jgi:hypothetical protein